MRAVPAWAVCLLALSAGSPPVPLSAQDSTPAAAIPGDSVPPDTSTTADNLEQPGLPADTAPPAPPAPGDTVRNDTVREKTLPDETRPDGTPPEETSPGETLPDETRRDETLPGETRPDGTRPDETLPDETRPDERPPGERPPGERPPGEMLDAAESATADTVEGGGTAAGAGADLIRLGDLAMERLEPAAALEHYQAAVTADPNDYEALWKTGRTLIDLGELENKGNPQKDKYNRALKYAERAIRVNPDGPDGHFVRGYALARVALFEGGKTKIRLSKEIKAEAQRAIDLDPLNDGAYHLLGEWNYSLADLNFVERAIANTLLGGVPKDASFENAAHYFELAIQANPEHIAHHLEYARTLLRLDRRDEARLELQKVLDLPVRDLDDAAHKEVARDLLKRLG